MGLSRKDRREIEADLKSEITDAELDMLDVMGYHAATRLHEAITKKQVGGTHYAKHAIQPWAIIDDWHLDYYLGNVIKYVLRDKHDQVEDLQKAIHYLEKKIDLLEKTK